MVDSHNGIPDDFWLPVPCGHPPNPVAAWPASGSYPVCHCGTALPYGDVLPGAPSPEGWPTWACSNCGCYVAVPHPPTAPLRKAPVPGLHMESISEHGFTGHQPPGGVQADYDQTQAWAIETLRKETRGFFLVTLTGKEPVPQPNGSHDINVATATYCYVETLAQQLAYYTAVRRVVDDQLARLRTFAVEAAAEEQGTPGED